MHVLLSVYGSRGDVDAVVGLAVRLRAHRRADRHQRSADLGQPLRTVGWHAHPHLRAAELAAAQFDTHAAAAEECDAPVATGVMPAGGWR